MTGEAGKPMCRHEDTILAKLVGIGDQLDRIEERQKLMSEAQQDIDNAIQTETTLLGDLTTQTTAVASAQQLLVAEIAKLQSAGVDTSGLDAISSQLAAAQPALDAAVANLTSAASWEPSGS